MQSAIFKHEYLSYIHVQRGIAGRVNHREWRLRVFSFQLETSRGEL